MKKFTTGAAALSLALGGLLLAPQVASATTAQPAAAYGCAGSRVGSWALTRVAGGPVYGHAYLYYSTASGGTNCAVYVTAMNVGTKRYMNIEIGVTDKGPWIFDGGNYAEYAGPVKTTGTNGKCIGLLWGDEPPSGGGASSGGVHATACG